MHRPLLLVALVAMLSACSPSEPVEAADVTDALEAVSAWLDVDDDDVDTDEAERRAARVVETTSPVVAARPAVEGLDEDQARRLHDALAGLRDSVAAQRDVLADCDDPDPAACIARSDIHPADIGKAVEAFQEAIAPLVARAAPVSGRGASRLV